MHTRRSGALASLQIIFNIFRPKHRNREAYKVGETFAVRGPY